MNKGSLLTAILLTACAATLATAASADPETVSTEHATVSLISEEPVAHPGETLWLGLHFELIPHWHVYWRNPGDSGKAPTVRWRLPEGWTAGDIHWPVPKRLRVGPLTNYGYEGTVTFLVPVQLPETPLADMPLVVGADVDWLVCREECIPESGRLSITLPAGDGAATSGLNARALFAASRARWPEPLPAGGRFDLEENRLAISVTPPGLTTEPLGDVWFATNEWGPVDASGVQRWQRSGSTLELNVPLGDAPPAADRAVDGLLVVEASAGGATQVRGFQVRLAPRGVAQEAQDAGLVVALAFALLGGLILNVMPCVLPVLGIKALGFVKEAHGARRRLVFHGLTYSGGILLTFLLLAAGLLLLRAGGESLGWGFQLQSPVVVTLLAFLMLAVGLNLSGVFSVGTGLMGAGQGLTDGRGLHATFATGILAVVVASPCTAPFMGAALGFALTRPSWEALAVFMALAVGFALPMLLLSLFPAWLRLIPKPGPWMKRLQQLLAFPMYATAAWLVWVLSQQTDAHGFGMALAGLVAVALAAWLYGQWAPRGWRLGLLNTGLACVLVLAVSPMAAQDGAAAADTRGEQASWSEERVRDLTAAGRPVFVNFTAAWCITCKVNEQVALSTAATQRLFEANAVAYLVADWTRRDPAITRQLERHGRSGVPLYLLYPPGNDGPRVLPQLLTEGIVADAVSQL